MLFAKGISITFDVIYDTLIEVAGYETGELIYKSLCTSEQVKIFISNIIDGKLDLIVTPMHLLERYVSIMLLNKAIN